MAAAKNACDDGEKRHSKKSRLIMWPVCGNQVREKIELEEEREKQEEE